ncbi:MAG: methyltransferase family protein [Microbacterium gubbeenense]|uniref:methyltransferase family protein n=1 Tax=Microbacterium gubbeenense TaxID=159896 RepID=UPI003F9C0F00
MPDSLTTPVRIFGILLTPRVARGYFAVQALAGAAWWILVATVPDVQRLTLGGLPPLPVAILDLPLFVGASAVAAFGIRWAVWLVGVWTVLVTAAMVVYATATESAGWGALAMIAASVASAAAAVVIVRGAFPSHWILLGPLWLREARPRARANNILATAAQLVVFWGLFLGVFPLVIVWFERRWELAFSVPLAARIAAIAVLVVASALGLWSAATMASLGDGTPLPSATARRLVIAGPYVFVRNPMAVAGIVQGVAVGLVHGSWLVVAWALCGSVVWNSIIRPIEERDLEDRFGDAFRAYRDRVSCWVPRRVWAGGTAGGHRARSEGDHAHEQRDQEVLILRVARSNHERDRSK